MNNKGFTLIELLAALVLLSILFTISYVSVKGVIDTAKDKAYNEQIISIENAAREYAAQNSDILPAETKDAMSSITVAELQQAGYLKSNDIKNAKVSNTLLDGGVNITYNGNKYIYTYGNDNLLTDTITSKTIQSTSNTSTNITGTSYNLSITSTEINGIKCTLSFDYKFIPNSGYTGNGYFRWQEGSPYYGSINSSIALPTTGSSGHLSYTFTPNYNGTWSNIYVRTDYMLGTLTISHTKLEIGSESTAYIN